MIHQTVGGIQEFLDGSLYSGCYPTCVLSKVTAEVATEEYVHDAEPEEGIQVHRLQCGLLLFRSARVRIYIIITIELS